jgi:hypothetical protein
VEIPASTTGVANAPLQALVMGRRDGRRLTHDAQAGEGERAQTAQGAASRRLVCQALRQCIELPDTHGSLPPT